MHPANHSSMPDNANRELDIAGQHEREGRLAEAINALSRAAKANPNDVDILVRLGIAYRSADRHDAARYVLERAVRLAAGRNPFARLTLASVLEQDQRPDLALLHYFLGLHEARAARRSVAADKLQPDLASLVDHAARYVATARRAWFERALQHRVHGTAAVSRRIELTLALYLNGRTPSVADPRQRTGMLHVPDLTTSCFLDEKRFAWLDGAAALIAGCNREMAACAEAAGTPQLSILLRGVLQYEARQRAPELLRALAELPLARVAHDAPDVEVIALPANGRVPLHYGRANSRCRLVINAADRGSLQVIVGGEERALDSGQGLVLDPSFGVEYANSGLQSVHALVAEIWHPELSEAEQQSLCALTGAAIDFDMRLQELNS